MENTRLRYLFARYGKGIITPDEERELMNLIADPSHRKDIEEIMSDVWDREPVRHSLEPARVDEMLRSITGKRTIPAWHYVYRIAAVFIVLILAGLGIYRHHANTAPNAMAIARPLPSGDQEPRALVLPDGSTVLLKNGSQLIYPETFDSTSSRTVILKGEGFFDIVHDPSKPFVVETGALQTHVLGTAFAIKAYESDPHITVIVSRGKVQVTDQERVIGTLIKDQQITFDKLRHLSAQRVVKSDSTIAWTKSEIHFDDVTFSDAVARLSVRFGVKVQFTDERTSQCRFTATFIEGESFIKVLEVICAFNHARYRQVAPGSFVIEGPGC